MKKLISLLLVLVQRGLVLIVDTKLGGTQILVTTVIGNLSNTIYYKRGRGHYASVLSLLNY